MKPYLHPQPVNDAFGDPAVYVDFLFEKRALLLDLGDIQALPPRKVLRISHVFVSHTHMDHFIGFDRIVRLCLGRERQLEMFGPPGFIDQVQHKLAAYTWNLVQNYETDFTIVATEWHPHGATQTARFRCQECFRRERCPPAAIEDGILLDEDTFRVRAVALDHRIPCLAFAIEEKQHINVWKNRLDELGLPTGPWLQDLKAAVRRGDADDTPFRVWWSERGETRERHLPLGLLRDKALRLAPGQKIAYVVDAVYHADNARRIIDLTRDADVLFCETVFLDEDADRAAKTYHLTATQAGRLAREAAVKHLVPMHFSARYSDREEALHYEAQAAFTGTVANPD